MPDENPLSEMEAAVEQAKTHDEADAATAALEEARVVMGPPMIAIGPNDDPEAWPPGRIVLGGRDHGRDAVELRARHIERGAMVEAHGVLLRLRTVATKFAFYLVGLPVIAALRDFGSFIADLNGGRELLDSAILSLEELQVEEAADAAALVARQLFGVANPEIKGLSGDAAVAKEALRSVSVQARRSAAQLRMVLAMRNLTHEEARMLYETTALDVAAMIQAHASDGMRFVYAAGRWTVQGVPGAAIHADEFGSALALALTRLRRT